MSYFKQTFMLNNEEKKQVSEMSGKNHYVDSGR